MGLRPVLRGSRRPAAHLEDRVQFSWYSSVAYYDRRSAFDESWSQEVAWGASRTIGDFDFAGVISRVLSVSSPIVALDATLRF